jgi:hypothetical protein
VDRSYLSGDKDQCCAVEDISVSSLRPFMASSWLEGIIMIFTRSLNRTVENPYLRFTGCVGTGMGSNSGVKEFAVSRDWWKLCISLCRFFTFTLNHSVRGLTSNSLLKTLSTGISFCYFVSRQAEPNIPVWWRSPHLTNFQNELQNFRKGHTITDLTRVDSHICLIAPLLDFA